MLFPFNNKPADLGVPAGAERLRQPPVLIIRVRAVLCGAVLLRLLRKRDAH